MNKQFIRLFCHSGVVVLSLAGVALASLSSALPIGAISGATPL
jgi:hypothetical protein